MEKQKQNDSFCFLTFQRARTQLEKLSRMVDDLCDSETKLAKLLEDYNVRGITDEVNNKKKSFKFSTSMFGSNQRIPALNNFFQLETTFLHTQRYFPVLTKIFHNFS